METHLTETQRRFLATIFERGAENATQALSGWLGRPVRLAVSAVRQVDMEEAPEVLGPADALVAACAMEVRGPLDGLLILVFEDRAGLALVDLLLHQPLGTTTTWGEMEQSAARETANIVGCSYLNSLAAHLPSITGRSAAAAAPDTFTPGPPGFRHEFAASLLEFALMDQAAESDRLLLIDTQFLADETRLEWTLLLVPSAGALATLAAALGELGPD